MHSRQAGAGNRNYRGRFCRSCAPLHAAAHDRRPQRSNCGRRDRDQPRGRSPYRSTCAIDDGPAIGLTAHFIHLRSWIMFERPPNLLLKKHSGPCCRSSVAQTISIRSYQSQTLPSLDFPRVFALTRIDHVTRLINGLHVGSVNVWELPGYRTEVTPFGGIKQSGLGYKERVLEAMRGFTQLKTYSLRGLSRPATGYSIPEN